MHGTVILFFKIYEGRKFNVRRMPVFFETFSIILENKDEIVRADISFRRAESKYVIAQIAVSCNFYGDKFNGQVFIDAPIVNSMQALLGKFVDFIEQPLNAAEVWSIPY